MLAEAEATPEREVCGLLFGTESHTVTGIQPCRNVAANPADAFEIDPQSLIAAHKRYRSGGPKLIGCYHSHPNGIQAPSRRDRECAGEGLSIWLIIAGGGIAAWRISGACGFESLEIEQSD